MPAQNFITDATIVKLAPRVLTNNLVMAHYVSQDLRKGYDHIVGASVAFRMPMQGYAQKNNLVINPTPINQNSIQFTVGTTGTASWAYNMLDKALSIQNFAELVMEPHLVKLAQQLDGDLCGLIISSPNIVGNPAAGLTLSVLAQARQYASEFDIPNKNRFGALDPLGVSELTINSTAGSLVNLFEPSMVKEIVTEGSIGRAQGADYFESQNVGALYTPGSSVAANLSITVNSADGDTFLTIEDSANGTLNVGDVIELTAINAVNPVSGAVLSRARQFVVTATTVLNSGAGTKVPIFCGGAIQATAIPGALVTCSALPTTATTIAKIWGTASTIYQTAAMFHREAFGLVVIAPPVMPGAVECKVIESKGIPMLYTMGFDVITAKSYGRIDMIYGVGNLHPEFCVRMAHN